MKLFVSLERPYKWIITDSRKAAINTGVIENLENYRLPRNIDQVIGVAPGELVACHSVLIPGKKRRYVESALPYALEEKLTEDVENLHFKLLSWKPDRVALAAVVSRENLSNWISRFNMNGIRLDAIVADYFLLPQHPKGEVTISLGEDDRIFVRRGSFQGFTIDRAGFDFWWSSQEQSGQSYSVTDLDLAQSLQKSLVKDESTDLQDSGGSVNHWKIGNEFTSWLKLPDFNTDVSATNILEGMYAPSHRSKFGALGKVAGFVALLGVASALGVSIYERSVLNDRYSQVDTEMRALFSSYFPEEPYLDRPRSQVSSLIAQAKAGHAAQSGFQVLLNAVAIISPKYGATVDEVSYRDNVMTVLCKVRDLSSLDTIIQAFNNLDQVAAELLSSGARDGTITGRFRLTEKG